MKIVLSNMRMIRPKTYRLIISDEDNGTLKVNKVEYLKKTNQHKAEWKSARTIGVNFVKNFPEIHSSVKFLSFLYFSHCEIKSSSAFL